MYVTSADGYDLRCAGKARHQRIGIAQPDRVDPGGSDGEGRMMHEEDCRLVSMAGQFARHANRRFRLLKASRYQAQGYGDEKRLRFESEFLRWMLSDGAPVRRLQSSSKSRTVTS